MLFNNVILGILFYKSSQRWSIEKVLKISQIQKKTPLPDSLFNKVTGSKSVTLLKKIL